VDLNVVTVVINLRVKMPLTYINISGITVNDLATINDSRLHATSRDVHESFLPRKHVIYM